jgi:glutamate N-acetyltransferase/amino-acid N-acetyltransferase
VTTTAVDGFVANGVHCGIKESGALDLALVATADRQPVAAAGVFTSNLATAAPVAVSREHLHRSGGHAVAVILNSGNANAATGATGYDDAERMCALAAEAIGCEPQHVLVCSTGLIGIPLPLKAVESGIGALVDGLSNEGGNAAAEAIRTTDTVRKQTVVDVDGCRVAGMAKGAAMLAPNMATMLAVLTTNASVHPTVLRGTLAAAVNDSFNALSVDGCTSTNDTVLVLARGAGGDVALAALRDATSKACADLATQMAADAEGATKVIRVRVKGARSAADAYTAARKVAESQLVKCSFYGEDPYWGRVVSELGSAGVGFDPDLVEVAYGGTVVCAAGIATPYDDVAVRAHLAERTVELTADLGLGRGEATVLTNDLTPGYIDENKRTS